MSEPGPALSLDPTQTKRISIVLLTYFASSVSYRIVSSKRLILRFVRSLGIDIGIGRYVGR